MMSVVIADAIAGGISTFTVNCRTQTAIAETAPPTVAAKVLVCTFMAASPFQGRCAPPQRQCAAPGRTSPCGHKKALAACRHLRSSHMGGTSAVAHSFDGCGAVAVGRVLPRVQKMSRVVGEWGGGHGNEWQAILVGGNDGRRSVGAAGSGPAYPKHRARAFHR